MGDLPVVCSLGPAALIARREDLLPTLARIVDLERQCCRFLQFTITVEPDEGPISLDLTGPPGAREFVAALMER
jgi:hypothetical protein